MKCICSCLRFVSAGCWHSGWDSLWGTAVPSSSVMTWCRWSCKMQRCASCCEMNTCAASLTCRPLPRSWGARRLAYTTATGVVKVTCHVYITRRACPDLQCLALHHPICCWNMWKLSWMQISQITEQENEINNSNKMKEILWVRQSLLTCCDLSPYGSLYNTDRIQDYLLSTVS